MYRRVTNIRTSAHFTHLRKFRNFVFANEVTIFSDHNPLVYLRECAPKSAKLTRWALGLQEFMHADSNIFHTSVDSIKSNQGRITPRGKFNPRPWLIDRRLIGLLTAPHMMSHLRQPNGVFYHKYKHYETVRLWMTFPFPGHYLPPQNSGPCNSFYCSGHFKSNKCIAVRKVATPLRELTCHMGSHSVTCHPTEVTFLPLPQPKLVLD